MNASPVRGFPLLQSMLVILAVVLAGVPVYRLTRPAAAKPAVAAPVATIRGEAAPTAALDVEAVFVPAPTDFEIKNLGQTVLTGRGPQARFTAHWTGKVPTEGADLVVQARWPVTTGKDGAPTLAAAKLSVRFPDGRSVEKSFWSDANGALTDLLTLPGTTASPDAP